MGMWWQWSCYLRPAGGVPALTCPPLQSPLLPMTMQKKTMQTSLRGGTLRRWAAAKAIFSDYHPAPGYPQAGCFKHLAAAVSLSAGTLLRWVAARSAARGTPGMSTHCILGSSHLQSIMTCPDWSQ